MFVLVDQVGVMCSAHLSDLEPLLLTELRVTLSDFSSGTFFLGALALVGLF